jgi:hypothetical protein
VGNGQIGPPTAAGLGGTPAEDLNASKTPGFKSLDLRLHRGFRIGDKRMRFTVDMRNPLHIVNTNSVYLETGEVTNSLERDQFLFSLMGDATLDGDANVDDFNIKTENTDNAVNKYMLLQAEARFGNGDGMFTVEEQRAVYLSYYNLLNNFRSLRPQDRSLRLGLEFVF